MTYYNLLLILFLYVILFSQNNKCECNKNVNTNTSYTWIRLIKELKDAVNECKSSRRSTNIWHCLAVTSFKKFDSIISSDNISLIDGVELVHYYGQDSRKNYLLNSSSSRNKTSTWERTNSKDNFSTWSYIILRKISDALSSHVLKINMNEWTSNEIEPRHRRHRNNMMVAMVFGITALGSIIIPLGFQFLAVLGGKALLLAKMALLLASINGLKRVAASGVHYGLYQVPEHSNYYDRSEIYHPRVSSN